MTALPVTVYHDTTDQDRPNVPASRTPRLAAVAAFTVHAAPQFTLHNVQNSLATIAEQLTVQRPNQMWALAYRHAGHRDLTVGDVVLIAGMSWTRTDTGWDKLPVQQFAALLAG